MARGLILRGSGDPALGDPFILEKTPTKLTVDGLVSALAGSVKTTTVGPVSEIIIDDRVFDRQWVHPTWPVAQLDKWYCAEVSGVNFHTNVISFFPSPATQAGRPPGYSLEPSVPWMEIENKARTVAGSKNTVSAGTRAGLKSFDHVRRGRNPYAHPGRNHAPRRAAVRWQGSGGGTPPWPVSEWAKSDRWHRRNRA
jgi:D-alanyl-D-alanine carboxypeptidase